jgi:hypothetical protein
VFDFFKRRPPKKSFASNLPYLLEIRKKAALWDEVVKLVKPDFTFGGKEPTQETPGYSETVNEVYQSILKNPAVRLTKKQEKEFINDYVQREIDRCTPHETEWTYGGYNFSEAQMDLVDHLTNEEKTKIGEIITKGLSENKRSYQIKQDFFGFGVDVDGDFFVKLHNAKGYRDHEEELMAGYYSGFDRFESEDEIYKFFNERKYLNKHLKLKERIIKNALYWFRETEE